MTELNADDVRMCEKVSKVLPFLFENHGILSDDTYTEKMISGFGQKLFELRQSNPEYCFQFWIASGAQSFVRAVFDQKSDQEVENFGLKFLSECVKSDVRIAEVACKVVDYLSRRNDFDLTQSNVFHLTKAILSSSDELSPENLSTILSLDVWRAFYLPILSLKVSSHFMQTEIFKSCSCFLAKMLEKFCQTSDFDFVCQPVFSDLANQNGKSSADFVSRILPIVLKKSFDSKSTFHPSYKEKLQNQILKNASVPERNVQTLSERNQDVKLMTLLVCEEYSTAQDFLLSHFQHTDFSRVDMKHNLASLKILLESLDQDNIQIQDYWRLVCERMIDDNRSDSSNLNLILDRLSAIRSDKFRAKISGKFLEILKSFFVENSDTADEFPRDLTLTVEQKIFSTSLTFFEQNLSDIFELDIFGQSELWTVLIELSKQSDLSAIYRSKVLDLMSRFLSLETLDVESLSETQSLFSQIWHLSRTGDWEILDSFFGLSTKIVRHRLEEIPFDLLLNFVRKNFENSNSFIRAASVELLFELLSWADEKHRKSFDEKHRKLFDVESFVENLFLFETEAIVRRICSKMMVKFDGGGKSPKIRRMLLRALRDLDWEVKEQVLEFWSQLLVRHLSENEFETFESFVRKMIEFDLILALNISASDFEQRHLHKTFLVLNEFKNFVKIKFPDLKIEDIQSLDIEEPALEIDPDVSRFENSDHSMEDQNGTSDDVIEDIVSREEASLIQDCVAAKSSSADRTPINLLILDVASLTSTKEFLVDVIFKIDLKSRLADFDDFCQNQIGLESLIDDILQSAKDVSAIDGIDCF